MGMSRRGFLGAMLAAATAPAIVKSENLMKIFVPKQDIIITADSLFESMGWSTQGLGADFDGDCVSVSTADAELCRQFGITPELLKGDTKWAASVVANNSLPILRHRISLAEATRITRTLRRPALVTRYPITSLDSVQLIMPDLTRI